ncbi:MAG: biopolymer transporter ExbD [Candidatus Solibacter usitatus]|nr:biopolymer transporter ExbD [Candidatus Solibacter usitatus]
MGKYRAAPPVSDINVTPMVDVMLVMLIIFMVITPMLSKGVSVDLVKTKNPIAMTNADKDDAVLVTVTRDGAVFLNTTKTTADALPAKVKDLLSSKLDKTVYVKGDSRAKFEKVVEVIDNVRSAGVDNIGLWTEMIQNLAGPASTDDQKKKQ